MMHPKDVDSLLSFAKETAAALQRLSDASDAQEKRIEALEKMHEVPATPIVENALSHVILCENNGQWLKKEGGSGGFAAWSAPIPMYEAMGMIDRGAKVRTMYGDVNPAWPDKQPNPTTL